MKVTHEQSEALQNTLFEMGYDWIGKDQPFTIIHSREYIFWYDGKKNITGGEYEIYFNEHRNPLHLFNEYFTESELSNNL